MALAVARPIDPVWVICKCGDPQSLHRFGNGVCMRVRRGSPCGCEKYEEPVEEPVAAAEPRVSLVDQYSVKPKGE